MNALLRRSLAAGLAALGTAGATPAFADTLTIPKVFDVDVFEDQIRTRLDGKTIGYNYAIYQNGLLKAAGGNGHAVLPGVPMTADKRVTLLSMSKVITAAALMRAMEISRQQGRNVSINSPIAPYLPPDWVRGRNVGSITFRDLLRHESGLRAAGPPGSDPDLYHNLMFTIARGVVVENGVDQFGKWKYCNCNFTLLRVMIPRMLVGPFDVQPYDWELTASIETAQAYVDFVREQLLLPVGLDVNVFPTGPTPYTRYYNFFLPQYVMPADRTGMDAAKRSGAGYWYMSAQEFGHFLSQVRMGNVISPSSWTVMASEELGLYRRSNATTSSHGGPYLTHNGGISHKHDSATLIPVFSGAHAAWMMFPNGVVAVLYHNAANTGLPDPIDLLEQSFNASYVVLNIN
jgi:CubicO group peptidase (beta-lactamase class C family)